jgi:cysteine desulfurase
LDYVLGASSVPALVCVMGANNETGVVQPLIEVGEMCALRGARLHVDAAQIAGRLAFDAAPYDFVTLSAHKIGGLQGVGALVLGEGVEIEPLWGGGAQELRRRPGTEAVAAITAFGAAARAAATEIGRAHEHAQWRDAMEARLVDAVPNLQVFGRDAPRLPQTSCLGVPGLLAETQLVALDLEGIAVSAGAACSSGKVAPSHVLSAMGAGEDATRAALRVSFGWATQETELERFTEIWTRVLERSLSVRRERSAVGA